MSQMLSENLECSVNAFTRPLEALSALCDLNPAVVVTDYYMPQLDGLEFVRRATLLIPSAAFVLITGHNLEQEEEHIAQIKALKAHLPKPFGWRTLANEIVRVWPEQVPALKYRVGA